MATVPRHKPEAVKKAPTGVTKEPSSAEAERPVDPARSKDLASAHATTEEAAAEQQSDRFDKAVRAFHARDYAKALGLFEAAAQGPVRKMAHSARLRAQMCKRRLALPALSLHTADDHYNYAVALINERKFPQAEQHLLLAIAQLPNSGHLYYALALCHGLAGNLRSAHANLKRAIELDPRNRSVARNDPDFAEIREMPPLVQLLYPERAASA